MLATVSSVSSRSWWFGATPAARLLLKCARARAALPSAPRSTVRAEYPTPSPRVGARVRLPRSVVERRTRCAGVCRFVQTGRRPSSPARGRLKKAGDRRLCPDPGRNGPTAFRGLELSASSGSKREPARQLGRSPELRRLSSAILRVRPCRSLPRRRSSTQCPGRLFP